MSRSAIALLLVVTLLAWPITSTAQDDQTQASETRRMECVALIEPDGSGVCRDHDWINRSFERSTSPELWIHSNLIVGAGIADNATLTWVDGDGKEVYKVDCRNLAGAKVFTEVVARPPTEEEFIGGYPDQAPVRPHDLPVHCVVLKDKTESASGRHTLRVNVFGDPGRLDGAGGAMDYEVG